MRRTKRKSPDYLQKSRERARLMQLEAQKAKRWAPVDIVEPKTEKELLGLQRSADLRMLQQMYNYYEL